MKFFPLVWRNLLRRKVRTTFTLLSVFVAFVLFGILMAIRVAFGAGVTIAGAERLMMIDKISLINPIPLSYQQQHRSRPRGSSTCRTPTGSAASTRIRRTSSPTWRSTRRAGCGSTRSSRCPEDQKKAWLADRTGAIVGADLAQRFGWKVGDRVPLQGVIYRTPNGAPVGVHHRRHLRLDREGRRQDAVLLPLRLHERDDPEPELRPRSGRLVRDQAEGSGAGGGDRAEARRRCSPTRRTRPRPPPRRRSSPASPSRSATSAAS